MTIEQLNQCSIIISIQISTLYALVRNTNFPGFYCTNVWFLVCNLGLFEITEWESCM